MLQFRKLCLALALIFLILLGLGLSGVLGSGYTSGAGLALAVFFALGLGALPRLEGYQYTAWIVAAVVAGMLFPERCLGIGDFDLRNKWLILIVVQLVMFGMGTQMKLGDFQGVIKTPKGVLVGLLCQFTIMPTMGWLLTRVFDFPAEIAAGIILIGSCSSGLASNVMAYIARANLALSVTVTAVATMVAPLMTPLLMSFFASTMVEVKFLGMMMSIVKIVLAPIGAALLADYLSRASLAAVRKVGIVAGLCLVWLLYIAFGGWEFLVQRLSPAVLMSVGVFGFFAAAIVLGMVYFFALKALPVLQKVMPYASMFGIVYFTTVTTAAGRDHLLQVGLLLLLAAVIHNASGYFLGYWFSRALGLGRNSARAMALEVGLQNGGMASGIAGAMGKLGTLGLASAVFSPWMNISGSILANIWSREPVKD
ncbi:bile acid:sodium symporter family protein [Pelagicoccus sp. SDUM812005]|uniref:bile acid:sodium symporter family protein n=1 Tax=Pelagicoccus sp. SDUM812005 TaxID=3041257 RepID=UPI0028107865|nr:bile acid:sodium symporter family protein [Pelagicoccus sp. SDUM812005]MDQ8179367.1 bile acid:sodium symporter family protein [Pelagicoccus sp. SDUM812005]